MFKKAALTLCALAAAALPFDPVEAGITESGPGFSAIFTPDTIGPGGTSMLTFTIDNSGGNEPVTDLDFSATLPAGQTIATPAQAQTDCAGLNLVLTASDGGTTISLTEGEIGAGQICTVMVNVVGTSTATMDSGDLTSSAGNSGPASALLTVSADRPGFTKSFDAETAINVGDRTTLTFTIDNQANGNQATSMTFTDILPTGLVVADPPNVVNNCVDGVFTGGIVVATPGSSTISLTNGGGINVAAVAAGQTCTISVDVLATGAGRLENVTGELNSLVSLITLSGGKAGAVLNVNPATDLLFTKSFIDDPAVPGGVVTLEFTITNRSRTEPATGIGFTDDLTTVLTGLTATLPPSPDPPCGLGSTLTAPGNVLTLAGGTLGPEESCTFQVTLNVPPGATAGGYPNTTGDLTAIVGGNGVNVPGASDTLFINNAPLITKTFLDDPVVAGGSTRLEFTITNTSSTSMATDITFIDDLTAWLPFPVSVTLPTDPCGAGSTLSLISLDTDRQGLQLTGGTLATAGSAGDSCTFEVTIDIPIDVSSGILTNTTDQISATVDGGTAFGKTATDDLEVIGGVKIVKEFTDDPVPPGGTATLQFTLSLDESAPADATGIAFTDDLSATLSGMTSASGTQTDICGSGSQITGTSTLDFTGGTLSPGESCTFSVQVNVPAAADPGFYTNSTSNVTATITPPASQPLETQGEPASDNLLVTGLTFSKEFLTNPVIPGGTTTLRFTLDNSNGAQAADITFFTDNLQADLPGLAATGAPTLDTCGGSLSGTTFLIYIGGSVPAGQSCVIEVPVMVPVGASSDVYRNQTSNLSVSIDGNAVTLPPAIDELTVTDKLLQLTKTFIDDPIAPGDTGTLEFTLTNLDPVNPATAIAFTDDLDAVLSGLVSASGTQIDICGNGSQIVGTGTLVFTGGNLGAGESCTFSVQVTVPGGADAGSYLNTVSNLTGTIDGLGVTGDPASDSLEVGQITFTKQFVPDTVLPGGIATLQFTIANNSGDAVSNIGFTDDLGALIAGATAIGTPIADVCGSGSMLDQIGSILSLTGGTLLPGGSCTFSVDVQIPPGAPLGDATNTTSELFVLGVPVADPATADLYVDGAGDTEETAQEVTLDQNGMAWVDGVLRPGDIDFFKFTVAAGSTAVVHTSGGLNTRGSVFDGSGNLLNDPGADDDLGTGSNFQSTQILGPGMYFVQVIGQTPDDTGPYMFHVELTALFLQPDQKIGRNLTNLLGNDIYNGNSAGQKLVIRGRAVRGRQYKYIFSTQNDGEATDNITIGRIGKRYNSNKWKARIFQLTGGRRNVTGAFESRSLVRTLAPTEQIDFQVKISLKSNSSRKIRRGFGERAISGLNPNMTDTTRSNFILRP